MELRCIPCKLLRFFLMLLLFEIISEAICSKEKDDGSNFKLTVVVLTMNRPKSLARLLSSLRNTDFEFDDEQFDVEIHVDKSLGLHYDECVE